MATVEWTGAITAHNTYNSKGTSGGTSTCYIGKNRKMRFTINGNSFLQNINIARAYFAFTLSGYWNGETTIYTGGSTSEVYGTVFPANNANALTGDVVEKPSKTWFYPVKTYYIDITETIKYAKANYSGTWYLWQSYFNDDGDARKYTDPKIYIDTSLEGSTVQATSDIYVYVNGRGWVQANAKVWNGSAWKDATLYGQRTDFALPAADSNYGKNNSDFACEDSQYASNSNGYFKAIGALGLDKRYGWRSAKNGTEHWVQYHLPYDAYHLQIQISNVNGNDSSNSSRGIAGPIAGKFYYTQAMSMSDTYTNMTDTGVSFSGRDGSTASVTTTHNINNSYPIRNILILITNWDNTKGNGCAIGNIQFSYSTKP